MQKNIMNFDSSLDFLEYLESIKIIQVDVNGNIIGKEEIPNFDRRPLIYLLTKKKEIYIGRTTGIIKRFENYRNDPEKNTLLKRYVIYSPYHNNDSIIQHLEAFLICHFHAEGSYKILNSNLACEGHYYDNKDLIEAKFHIVWKKLKMVKMVKKDIEEINKSDIFKYSPYKTLSEDQKDAIIEILHGIKKKNKVVVNGCAGTGKTILAIYLIKLLTTPVKYHKYYKNESEFTKKVCNFLERFETNNACYEKEDIALVVSMGTLRKTLQKIFSKIAGLSSGMIISPTSLVNKPANSRLVLVDESHRLRSRKNLTGYKVFDDCNRKLGLKKEEGTELDWILSKSDNQVFFYDSRQTVRPTDICNDKFVSLQKGKKYSEIKLKSQHRCKGGEEYVEFVYNLLDVNIFENKLFKDNKFEFSLFDDIRLMHSLIVGKQKKPETSLSYMVSGFSWKWDKSKDRKPEINIEGYLLFWNEANKDFIHSTKIHQEVGCIHTVQGFDMSYVGIIFGEEIDYSKETKEIVIYKDKYQDRKGKDTANYDELKQYIINIYSTLLLRGIDGVYVYCCNKNLRNYFSQYIPEYIAVEDKTKNL